MKTLMFRTQLTINRIACLKRPACAGRFALWASPFTVMIGAGFVPSPRPLVDECCENPVAGFSHSMWQLAIS